MISGLVVRSSFTSTKCSAQEQGGIVRKLRPLSQINGLNLRYPEPKNLTFKIAKGRISASLEKPIASSNMSFNTTITQEDAFVSPTIKPEDAFVSPTIKPEDAFVQESSLSIPWIVNAFYRFSRPYTIYGTIVAIVSMAFLPVQTMADLSPAYFVAILQAVMSMVLMNICHSGINQISDVGIDAINKPNLPIASGEFSMAAATAITCISAVSSFLLCAILNSPPLLYGNLMEFLLAIAYSVDLPFLRWKKNIFTASLCIVGIRALIHTVCPFIHFQKYVLGRPLVFTKPIIFTVAFMTLIFIVCSLLKDIPDVKGDKAFGLRSPSIVFGVEKVFWSSVYALMAIYGGSAIFGATSTFLPNKIITVLGHGIIAAILWARAKSVNVSEPSATLPFYLFVWKLIYAEYFLLQFVR